MKGLIKLATTLIGTVSAAPAITWIGDHSSASPPTIHNSDPIELRTVLRRALHQSPESSSLDVAIFLLQRDVDGNDGITAHASNLPTISALSSSASTVEHYVRGLSCPKSIKKVVQTVAGTSRSVVETTLDEFRSFSAHDFSTEADVAAGGSIVHKRALAGASVALVHVNARVDAATIDAVVSAAVEDGRVGSVVLTSLRSEGEAKLEKRLQDRARREPVRAQSSVNTSRRRLEENEVKGVYFVNFSPNIFAGLLFFFFFVMVTYTGISCMGMISGGDDYYVEKYPHIGREV